MNRVEWILIITIAIFIGIAFGFGLLWLLSSFTSNILAYLNIAHLNPYEASGIIFLVSMILLFCFLD